MLDAHYDAPAWADETVTYHGLVAACLDTIARRDGEVHAFTVVCPERALRCAAAVDRAWSPDQPLRRFPIAVKDVVNVRGLPTRAGSRIMPPTAADRTAASVRQLERAGAVVLGKSTTHEFAYGAVSAPTRNPHDLSRIAGGSSGGSAAAVAAGFVRAAVGTDTGGSVRLPAALCGVWGMRPRRALVSFAGALPLAPSFDAIGLIAGTLSDVRRLVAVVGVPSASPAGTVGIPLVDELDDEVARAMDEAIRVQRSSRSIDLPPFSAWFEPRMAIQMRQALAVHRRANRWPQRAADYSAETRRTLEAAEAITDGEVRAARQTLRRLHAALLAAFDRCDTIMTPTTPMVAPTYAAVEELAPAASRRHPVVGLLSRFTLPFATPDLASLSTPWPVAGLPVGIQFAAPTEVAVLGAAESALTAAVA